MAKDKYTMAVVVDHITPHRRNKELFWDKTNWQALCKRCHDRKTGSGN
jgi:5-methylcytosine-specific restriction protein A